MLNVILGRGELALRALGPDHPVAGDLKEIVSAARASADLTRQLLAFARKQTASPRILDLNEIVGSMLKMLGRLIGEGIELKWLPGPGLWPVRIDPVQVDQVLANLAVNARDALGGEGRLEIATANLTLDESSAPAPASRPGNYVMLSVRDNGCGMDGETQAQIFEPFFTTKEKGEGTGLGLSMVWGVVEQNGGFIGVESRPGEGTTFRLWFPRHQGKAEPASVPASAEPSPRGRDTILVVEDDPANLRLTTRILKSQGYEVLSAARPGEAIARAREHPGEIDLLLTDVVMPEMNGRDLAKNLLSLYPELKRLFMSGYTADVIAHHGVLEEGVNFIQKPFSLDALLARVREVLK
jgi:CheY-like chemotaxis protein